MTDVGRPLSKLAIFKIENGERKITLDEALALADVLAVAPAHLLTPIDDEFVWLTDKAGVDGDGLRHFLLTGQGIPAWPKSPQREDEEELRLFLERALTAYGLALVDAGRGGDRAGAQAAVDAMTAAVDRHRQALAQINRVEGGNDGE
jgi:hypothetical protein